MNTKNMIIMAEYLEKGPRGEFNMRNFNECVLAHAGEAIEEERSSFMVSLFGRNAYADSRGLRLFGISETSQDWDFYFAPFWSNNAAAAAARLRYGVQHGSAPSRDQWKRFDSVPSVVEIEESDVTEEVIAA